MTIGDIYYFQAGQTVATRGEGYCVKDAPMSATTAIGREIAIFVAATGMSRDGYAVGSDVPKLLLLALQAAANRPGGLRELARKQVILV